jgi:type IV pilus assembly protein PilC
MPLFTYKAVRDDGTSVVEKTMATDAAELRQMLEAKGYLVLDVRKREAVFGTRKGGAKEFLIFNQEFTTLVKAGLPILQALEILHHRSGQGVFHAVLSDVIQDIKGGKALSDAMAVHPAWFPPLYTATVRAGEQSGALVDVLKRFIEYQKKMLAVRRKLVTSLAYPVFLVIALIVVLSIFIFYVIPNFTQMYGDAKDLPALTSVLIAATQNMAESAPLIFTALAACVIGLYLWQRSAMGKRVLDGLKLRIPLVRTLMIQYILAQLTRTLATVLRGGIPLVQALDTTAGVIANSVVSRRLVEARKLVTEGVSLADSFERTAVAPDMTVRMIEVGESSGDLPQMLEDVADFYDQEVENKLTALTTMIEPVLMLSMGLVIAVIVVALYLPIFEMGARLK